MAYQRRYGYARAIASQKMEYDEFKKLAPQEQKRITSVLVSAVNKRIRALEKTEIGRMSPTYQAFLERGRKSGMKGGKFYSVKGLEGSALYNRFESLQRTYLGKTTPTAWMEHRAEVLKEFNLEGLSPAREKSFWRMYNKFVEDKETGYLGTKKEQSQAILEYISNKYGGKGGRFSYNKKSREDLIDYIKNKYEEKQRAIKRAKYGKDSSSYVSDEESEED